MAFCSKCGTQLSDGAKFCPNCGNPTERTQTEGAKSDNPSNYCIELVSAGPASLQLVKAIKETLNLSLKDAKDYVDSIPCVIKTGLSLSEAKKLAQIIEASGAKVNVKQGDKSSLNNSPSHSENINLKNHIIQEDENQKSLSIWNKIALGFAGFIAFLGIIVGFGEGMWLVVVVSLCAMAAICCVFMDIIEKKYVWTTAICSFLAVFLAIGISDESNVRFKKFEAVEDGRAAYAIDSAHYENSDVQSISKIVMYEGNGRQDCKAEGVNGEGQLFAVDGKWEKKALGNTSIYYYYLDYKYFKLLLREDSVVCYYKGDNDNVSSIENAWGEKRIGKIRDMPQEQEKKLSENFSKKMKEQVENTKPMRGSKDADWVKKRIAKGSIWTYTQNYGNPIGWWFRLKFDNTNCEVYDALPADGEWKFRYKTPYYVEEKRLDDGKRYVFVCLRYSKDDYGNMREDMYPMKINITQGSFIYGASGAIGFIDEKDYKWD